MVCCKTVLPPISRYCLGLAAPKRLPLPAAGDEGDVAGAHSACSRAWGCQRQWPPVAWLISSRMAAWAASSVASALMTFRRPVRTRGRRSGVLGGGVAVCSSRAADEVELFAGHGEVDFGEEFAVDECAVVDAFAAVDVEAAAQGVEAGFLAGVFFARHGEGVGYFAAEFFDGGQPHALEFHVEEADVEAGVVDDEFGTAQEVGDFLADGGEFGGVFFRRGCRG